MIPFFFYVLALAIVASLLAFYAWRMFIWTARSGKGDMSPTASSGQPSVESDLAGAERLLEYARFQNWLTAEQDELLAGHLLQLRERVASVNRTQPPVSQAALETNPKPEAAIVAAIVIDEVRPRSLAGPTVHPLDQTEPPARPFAQPSVSKRVTGDILRSFMERSNIRWVELVSATLVVVCSVGLVISLWSTLSRTSRFFPSLVFMFATLAVHGAGQYTLRRWKLRTTSRGILHIGLLLIPLAVLVGMLLSSRGEMPELNGSAVVTLVIGALVYSALAITAARVLFPRQYGLIAASTIAGSATLVAIHYFAARQPDALLATGLLAPIVILSAVAALVLSWRYVVRLRWTPAFIRRQLGTTVQVLFAVVAVCIFWYLQFKGTAALSPWWWTAVGMVAVAWSGWAWVVSMSPLGGSRLATAQSETAQSETAQPAQRWQSRGPDVSWMIVGASLIGVIGTLFLLACCWQASMTRESLIALLAAAAVWWSAQGSLCRRNASLLAGSLAGILALAILAETMQQRFQQVSPGPMRAIQWISFERIHWLALFGGLAALGGVAVSQLAMSQLAMSQLAMSQLYGRRPRLRWVDERLVGDQLALAGGLSILTAAALTILASAVPWGETPYGGNWAGLSLAAYSIAITAAGIALPWRRTSIETGGAHVARRMRLEHWLVPAGQALSIWATVRLCQTNSLMPQWIEDLRPTQSWAVGLASLAALWAVLAAVLKQFGWESDVSQQSAQPLRLTGRAVDWLIGQAIVVAIVSAAVIWRWSDRLEVAAAIGWTLPVVAAGIWWSWQARAGRELFLITFCVWACAGLFHAGDTANWWSEWGLAASAAVHVSLCLAIAAAFVGAQHALRPPRFEAWITAGYPWALSCLLIACLAALLGASAPPAFSHLGQALGFAAPEFPSTFVLHRPDDLGLTVLAGSIALLVGVTWYASAMPDLLRLRALVGFAPLAAALAVAAWADVPWALAMAAWMLGAALLASELPALFGEPWREHSQRAWEEQVHSRTACAPEFAWLALGRSLSFVALVCLTLFAFYQACRGQLASELMLATGYAAASKAGWFDRVLPLVAWMGPLLCVVSVRWLLGVLSDASPRLLKVFGIATALMVGCFYSLTIIEPTDSWAHRSIAFLHSAAIAFAALAALTAALPLARNFLAIRALTAGAKTNRELMRSACKGGRWKRAESAAWTLSVDAAVALGALGIIAAATNAWYPVESLPVLGALARWPSLVAFLAVTTMLVVIGRSRSVSSFALLAIALAMLAPLAAAYYANWLDEQPKRLAAEAHRFEPYRAQIVLWILALAIGLAVRLRARGQPFSATGEALWVGLATVVGLLGWIGIVNDQQKVWPAGELSSLALVMVLSGLASGQKWRGHVAAVVAASGILAWHFTNERMRGMSPMWLTFWGPVWIAVTAVVWTIVEQATAARDAALASPPPGSRRGFRSVDQTVSVHVPIVISLLSGIWVLSRLEPGASWVGLNLPWVAGLAAAAVLLASIRLWDHRSGRRGLAVYLAILCAALTGAVVLGEAVDTPFLTSSLLWMAAGLSALAIAAALLREWMRERSRLLPALRLGTIEGRQDQFVRARIWMVPLHSAIGLSLLLPCILLVLNFQDRNLRLATAALPFLSALGILPIAVEPARRFPRSVGLLLISVAWILVTWSDLPYSLAGASPEIVWRYFERTFVALVALSWFCAWLSEVMRNKLDWAWLLHRAGWTAIALGSVCGASMVALALSGHWAGAARFAQPGDKLLVLSAWAGVVVRCLQLALAPRGLDREVPIGMRRGAVYAAELSLGLLSAATYCAFPNLFSGVLARWWPMIVFGIAMLSGAAGQWFERFGRRIVSDPVRRSSLLLPLIPLVGVWWPSAQPLGIDWSDWQRYSLLLLIAAALYGMHGWMRPSIGLRALSAGLTLLAFWALLYSNPSLHFFEHPQFWLLPPAVGTLIFVEASRKRLDLAVVIAVRYLAILVAYLSSSADMFLKAFEGQMWQPLVLLMLAVTGVLAGVALRVRAFLYSGACFVLVALVGMVWHAQQAIDQVWPWWAFGILTGITLIAMLGYFEKNRPQVLAYLERLKSWEG